MNGYLTVRRARGGFAWQFEVLDEATGRREVVASGTEESREAARKAGNRFAFGWECGN